jgi:hypothetical protein
VIKVTPGDYLIVRSVDNPNSQFLGQLASAKNGQLIVTEERDRHIAANDVEIEADQVLVNLGSEPHPGKVYGIDVENLYRATKEHPVWGSICFFRPLPKELAQALRKALDKTGERLTAMGFEPLFERFVVEILNPHGQYGGMYVHKKGKDAVGRLKLYLTEEHAAGAEMNYILYHEFGHAIQCLCLHKPSIHAAWMKLFRTSVQCKPIGADTFNRLKKAILSVEQDMVKSLSPPELINSTEDDDLLAFKVALRYMSQVYHVSARDFRSLLEAGSQDTVKGIWPKIDIDVDDLKPIVSEYATKNVSELFAESFAYYMTKSRKLPSDVHALMEKSLSYAKHSAQYLDQEESYGEAGDE